MNNPAEKKKSDRIALAICFLLALMVWGVFGQTLRHEFVNYDDDIYVYGNTTISKGVTLEGLRQMLTNRHAGNWHPLTTLSHMLDCQIYGLNPAGHHGTNILLHMATVILLFLVLRQMTGSLWRSAFVAAVFAIHPLRAESVAWISERKDVLSGFFFMLTLAAYLRYVRRPFSVGRYAAVAVLFTLGLMSKAMLVTLPFVLLLLDFWPLGRFQTLETKKTIVRLVLEKIPILLLSAVFCGVTIWAEHESTVFGEAPSVPQWIGTAFCSYVIYMKQMIFPTGLVPFYPRLGVSLPLWEIGLSIALLASLSWGVFAGRKKYPYLITGWCWYLGMLVPVIGLLQAAHADRYTYLPQIGLAIMVTWMAADWCASLRYRRVVLSVAAAAALAALAIAAHRQTQYWRDSFSLWTRTLACTDRNYMAQTNLGVALHKRGELDEEIKHYEIALAINPNYALAYYNLGFALDKQGRADQAIACYEKSLELNPGDAKAYSNLGAIFFRQGQLKKAIPYLEKALGINPDLAEVLSNLGAVFADQGQSDKAIPYLERAIQINPGNAEAHSNLGSLFARQGQFDKAIPYFERALEINPDFPDTYYNLGVIFGSQGQFDKAITYFEKALKINPNSVEVQNNLAWILATCPDAALRDGKRAVELARSADQLSGGNCVPVLNALAAAYAEAGQYPEAVATARRALDLVAGQEPVAEGIRMRLRLYEAGVPYHESRGEP